MLRASTRRILSPILVRRLVSNVAEPEPHASLQPLDAPSLSSSTPEDSSPIPGPSSSPSLDSVSPQQLEELGISISRPSFNNANSNSDTPEGSSGIPSVSALNQKGGPQVDRFAYVIPFDTHQFYTALETSFEPPVARSLMKATRGLLVDRIRNTYNDVVQVKDFDNGAYLFRAALSELRTELTMRTRKETATLRTALTALRKETDILDAKMKEDIASLKHDIQMDMNNRKAEAKADAKLAELAMEDLHHRTIVRIGDLRTDIEQAKWNNTRRGVLVIGTLVIFVIFSMELAPKKPAPPPPPPPPAPAPVLIERPLPSVREMESDDTLVTVHPEERT
ncbi:hypothetical protein FRB94_005504 [Tulasnella sp. JGI-2019a]|nr:hypothetical protein FRB93_005988 [Tulasnella sp. JGI-2019a]KAG9012569.1 hypothetical protein FRB94_005504 [Tulasnella sp. JGI-2019a]